MVPRELIDTADVPGGAPLRLFRRGGDYMIVLDRNQLMNSRTSGDTKVYVPFRPFGLTYALTRIVTTPAMASSEI